MNEKIIKNGGNGEGCKTLGFIGIGKYGSKLANAVIKTNKFKCYIYDKNKEAVGQFKKLTNGSVSNFEVLDGVSDLIQKSEIIVYGLPHGSADNIKVLSDIEKILLEKNQKKIFFFMDNLRYIVNFSKISRAIYQVVFNYSIDEIDDKIIAVYEAYKEDTFDRQKYFSFFNVPGWQLIFVPSLTVLIRYRFVLGSGLALVRELKRVGINDDLIKHKLEEVLSNGPKYKKG